MRVCAEFIHFVVNRGGPPPTPKKDDTPVCIFVYFLTIDNKPKLNSRFGDIMRTIIFVICMLVCGTSYADEYTDRVAAMKSVDYWYKDVDRQGWREPLLTWAYRLSNYMRLDRANVSLTAELFEALLRHCDIPEKDFGVYFTACFCVATKINQCELAFKQFEDMSDGRYTVQDLVAAEKTVRKILGPPAYLPTPGDYVEVFFEYVEALDYATHRRSGLIRTVRSLARREIELRVFEPKLQMRSWQIAKTCLIRAINKVQMTDSDRFLLYGTMHHLFQPS